MGRNLTNLYISESFNHLLQISGSEVQTGLGVAVTGSLTEPIGITVASASYALSASHEIIKEVSSSYADFAQTAESASHALQADSSSYAFDATSASFADTSAVANNALSANNATSASYALTASFALNTPTLPEGLVSGSSQIILQDTTGDLSGSRIDGPVSDAVNAVSSSHAVSSDSAISSSFASTSIASGVSFDDTNFAYTASNVQVALKRLSDNKADISLLTSNVNVFPTTASADVGGYVALVTSSADARYIVGGADVPTGTISGSNQLIASLITDGALFTGDPGLITVTTVGQIRRVGGGTNSSADFYYEVYKRSGSVETLIATSNTTTDVNVETYEEFSATAILTNGVFTEDDRIVIKYYGSLVDPAGADPSFEFKFGGTNPVKTLFPVPASVLVSPWNGQFTGDATITGTLNVTAGITGSLNGNADTATLATSATSASHALNADQAISASHAVNSDQAISASHALVADAVSDANVAYINENNSFTGTQTFDNITVNGTGSFAYIHSVTGSAKIIGDAFVQVNTDSPTLRYGGIKVVDSGSAVTASLQWDSEKDIWMQEEVDGTTAALLTGLSGSKGVEALPTKDVILKGGGSHTVTDSNISDDGSTITLGSATQVDGDLDVLLTEGDNNSVATITKGASSYVLGINQFPGFTGSILSANNVGEFKITGDTALALDNTGYAGSNNVSLNASGQVILSGSSLAIGGDTTVTGVVTSNFTAPSSPTQHNFLGINGVTFTNGASFTNSSFSMQNYGNDFSNYKNALVYEFWDSFGYNYGADMSVSPVRVGMTIIPSGSGFGQQSYMEVQQQWDGTSFLKMAGPTMQIGDDNGFPNTTNITLKGTNIEVTGSASFNSTITGTITNAVSASHAVSALSSSYALSASYAANAGDVEGATDTGTTLSFDNAVGTVYNTAAAGATGNITLSTTDAKVGASAVIFHEDSSEPTVSGMTVDKKIGTYDTSSLNVITFVHVGSNHVIQTIAGADTADIASTSGANTFENTNTFDGAVLGGVTTLGTSGTVGVDVSTGNFFSVTPSDTITLAVSGEDAADGQTISILIDNSGSETVSFTGVLWPEGTAPTITAGGVDIVTLITMGGNVYGTAVQNFS
jgi:hypothetical protein